MQSLFQAQAHTIAELLSGANAFRIPAFQRPYSWDEAQAAQLYDDLDVMHQRAGNFSQLTEASGYYFIGPIIVARANNNEPFDVVDGQQRLVTLSLLLAVLRDALPPSSAQADLHTHLQRPEHSLLGHAKSSRVLIHSPAREEFEQWTEQVGSTNHLPNLAQTEATERILRVIRRLKQEVGSPRPDAIEAISRFILDKTFTLLMNTTTLDDAYLLFRSVNTPGQSLSPLDLVKADILGRSSMNDPETHRLADAWVKFEEELEYEKRESYVRTVLQLVMPTFDGRDLRAGLRAIMQDSTRRTVFRGRLESLIKNYASLDSATLDFGANSNALNRVVACFQGLPFDDWRPTALLWLSIGPASNPRAGGPSPIKTADFFRLLNALCLGFVILGTTSGKRTKRFERINQRINEGKDVFALDSELLLTRAEHVEIRERLRSPLPERAKFVKPLLLRINAEMLPSEIPPYFPNSVTIEHVLPLRPAPRSGWVRDFPNAKRRKELCSLLGNLTLLTHPANSAIGNGDFRAKKDGIFGVNGNQCFALNSEIASTDQWTEQVIRARHDRLLDLADRVLRL
jgi:hypothetical protein